jgi:hypothetical protein
MWGKRNPHTLLYNTTTIKNNMEAPQKLKIELPYVPAYYFYGHTQRTVSQVTTKAPAHPCLL